MRDAGRPMAIAAIKLYHALRRLQVLFEMNLVIEFDAAGIDITWPQRREFRMSRGERFDMSGQRDFPTPCFQIPMAAKTGISGGGI